MFPIWENKLVDECNEKTLLIKHEKVLAENII